MLKTLTSLSFFQRILLVLVFAGALSLAFLDLDYYPIVWCAFVPLLLAIHKQTRLKIYLLGLTGGFVAYLAGTYWLVGFIETSKGYNTFQSVLLASLYWLYCAHGIAFLLLAYDWLKRNTRVSELVLFPALIVIVNNYFPMLFAMRLGESQVLFTHALQATQWFGVHGLDFVIGLVNMTLFRLLMTILTGNPKALVQQKWSAFAMTAVVCGWFLVGGYQYQSWEQKSSNWPSIKVGLVQPNEIPEIGKRALYAGHTQSYPPEMEMSERLASLGAELVVWAEAQPKDYLNQGQINQAFRRNVGDMSTSLLFQDMQQIRDPLSAKIQTSYNSAVFIQQDGMQQGVYQKMQRIPFGEYIPLFSDSSFLRDWIESFLGDFLDDLSAGTKHGMFHQEKVDLVPLICYETTFPGFVASAIGNGLESGRTASGTLLVALSNDGWFGSSKQPYQHVMASILRAVENRVPLVHVANNGPSIVVMPSGKVIFISDFQKAGGYLVDVPYSPSAKGSFYSQHPFWFERTILLMVLLLIGASFFKRLSAALKK